MKITTEMIAQLRARTGAGVLECKDALTKSEGVIEDAVDFLRKKGLSSAAKKSDRVANEGVVACVIRDNIGYVVEINCETDFVARNEKFQAFAAQVINAFVANNSINTPQDLGEEIERERSMTVAGVGENIVVSRMTRVYAPGGHVFHYVHNLMGNIGDIGIGRIATLIAVKTNAASSQVIDISRKVGMQIASMRPLALRVQDIPHEVLAREKEIYREQAATSGKPAEVVEKMVEGRLRKFCDEIVLLEQEFVIGAGGLKVKEVISNFATENKIELEIASFVRYEVGSN